MARVADKPIFGRDFRILAELRAEDAGVLLKSRRTVGAYYLAGYAVECALKACIAKQQRKFQYPPKRPIVEKMYRHDLGDLVDLAGLKSQLDKDLAANRDFAANWNTVKDWTAESRYATSGLNAQQLYNAVTEPQNGVLPWIKLRW